MITKIDDVYNNFSKGTCDKIELIRNERKKKKSDVAFTSLHMSLMHGYMLK